MAKSQVDESDVAVIASDLLEAMERLNQRMAVLIQVMDELRDELQWRNNELDDHRESSVPPFVLRSMPVDLNADDWELNRVPSEEMAAMRQSIAPLRESLLAPPDVHRPADYAADLRQIVAALILLSSDACTDELEQAYDWLLVWASQELDIDVLRQALSDYVITDDEETAHGPKPPAEHQGQLFTATDE